MFLGRMKMRFSTLLAVAPLMLVALVGESAFTASVVARVATEPSARTETVHRTHVVLMSKKFTYVPATIVVKVGDVVEWENKDIYQHTVTATDRSFNSGNINPGARWRYKAVKVGTYDYFCTLHPNMEGKLIVR